MKKPFIPIRLLLKLLIPRMLVLVIMLSLIVIGYTANLFKLKKNAILAAEFNRYVVEHPKFAAKIPRNTQIILQVEGDDEYNEWSN